MKYWSKMACLCLSACLLSVTASQAEDTAAAIQKRGKTVVEIKPDRIILIDIAQAGSRLVAVGERGFALLSDDGGKTWKARETPVTRTLTGVAFRDAQVGVAVGHGGSFVRTESGGDQWTEVKVPEAEPESLLGVVELGGDHFAAYGAFGMYFDSTDAGKTWKRVTLFDPDFDRHISDVVRVGKTLLMVAESGTLARSDDEGATWTAMTSPYVGSYFGAVATADGTVLAFGMRGNVWRTTDLGATWQKIPLNTTASLNGGRVLSDGRILLVGNSGLLALSKDGGQTLELHWAPGGHGYAAVAETGGHIILAGETGITTLDPSWLSSQ